MRATIVWRDGWRRAPDDSQQLGFQTTASRRERREQADACAIDGQRRGKYCRRRALLWWYSAGYGRAGKAYGGGVNQALRQLATHNARRH